ncbi:hypothetical protein AgCh_000618 [Apium graveolens]
MAILEDLEDMFDQLALLDTAEKWNSLNMKPLEGGVYIILNFYTKDALGSLRPTISKIVMKFSNSTTVEKILTNRKYQYLLESVLNGSQNLRISELRSASKDHTKEKSEYTAEDISSIAKDAKVRHFLHSAIDNVMSNRVIHCKTVKEIWDALETRYQGTDTIKKNRRTILTQEYEHFDSKVDESLTDLYDRFVKLLNDLSLVDKEYDLEDSNLKFLLALPESWDLKSTTIRDNYALDETTLDEIYGMKLCALMVKGITKIAYRKFRRGKKFSKKGGSTDKKGFRKYEGKSAKSDRGDNSNVKCYNYGERGHISPGCKKGKSEKGKALVTKKKSWTDSSNSEDEVNYALMANADGSPETAELKVPQTTYAFHTDDITEFRLCLKTMFISYRDQTLTCERLTSENLAFKKRNDYLAKELVKFHQTQKERDDAIYVRDEVLKLNQSLKTELEKEREIIRTWTNFGRTTKNLLSSGNWKEGLGYGYDKSEKGTEQIEPNIVKQTAKPKVNPVKFVAKTVKSDSGKMKESVIEVKDKSTSDKLEQDKPAEVNIGLMTKKRLKHKLKEIRNVNKVKAARKNRNERKGNMKNILVLNSGCSGHMTGNKALLSNFVEKAGPGVSYGDGNTGKTLG